MVYAKEVGGDYGSEAFWAFCFVEAWAAFGHAGADAAIGFGDYLIEDDSGKIDLKGEGAVFAEDPFEEVVIVFEGGGKADYEFFTACVGSLLGWVEGVKGQRASVLLIEKDAVGVGEGLEVFFG